MRQTRTTTSATEGLTWLHPCVTHLSCNIIMYVVDIVHI